MDQSSLHPTSPVEEDDEWDTDGFVIPSLGIENPDQIESDPPKVDVSKSAPLKDNKLEKIYLGPHGAPPQQKQQEQNPTNCKQRFKQKLKEADKKIGSTGRENRVESLRELVGGSGKVSGKMAKGSSKDWLDPHCDESLFVGRNRQ
ncbi:uncharacterized protein LOC110706986 [Chenopodium quinoa]|uniref:Uncharacterized protein n=1 Tax=Chenopodium quinoa TaxID=63459 RepID=A0A803LQ56_CHEQI|nr:uncharacterized protein LOC110706986 [Chenopodium quinoa]